MPNPDDERWYEQQLQKMSPEEKAREQERLKGLKSLFTDVVIPKFEQVKQSEERCKPILCLDFDGVCHSYTSSWKGADVIPDPPVDGLFDFLLEAEEHFEIHIFSTRSLQDGGIEAMTQWFDEWREKLDKPPLKPLHFPLEKPPALVILDDRAITFTGIFPDVETLRNFKPWNNK